EAHSINVKPRPQRIRQSPLRREPDALLAIVTGHKFTNKEHAFIGLTPTFCPRFRRSPVGRSSVRDGREQCRGGDSFSCSHGVGSEDREVRRTREHPARRAAAQERHGWTIHTQAAERKRTLKKLLPVWITGFAATRCDRTGRRPPSRSGRCR